jgi:hypothetical protein
MKKIVFLIAALVTSVAFNAALWNASQKLSTINQALLDTGISGTKFQVELPNGKTAVAGMLVDTAAANSYTFDQEGLEDVIRYIQDDGLVSAEKIVIMKRPHTPYLADNQ